MKPVILAVHENEKAYSLREINLTRPPLFQERRWQVITVVRNDQLAEWWNDMGPAEDFTAMPFEVPSLGIHSVAELRDIALSQHDTSDYWAKFADEQRDGSTLIADYIAYREENKKRIHNVSVFGPGVTHQRNGFPRQAAIERQEGWRAR